MSGASLPSIVLRARSAAGCLATTIRAMPAYQTNPETFMARSPRRRLVTQTSGGADCGPAVRQEDIYGHTASSLLADSAAGRAPTKVLLREPTVMPGTWRDPEDTNPNARRPREITGSRAADPLRLMLARGKGETVTEEHIKAADRLAGDYETGFLGANPEGGEKVAGGGGFSGGSYPPERQLAAMADFRRALRVTGARGSQAIMHVVLGIPDPLRRDIATLATRWGISSDMARGVLVGALDALVAEYWPPERSPVEDAIDAMLRSQDDRPR